jgi:pimeloyl-ACP methyl ester carboxylesterase
MSSPQRLAVGDAEIAYEIVGGGPIELVFLHEGLGSIELWRSFPRDVTAATGTSGVVYDRRGHGRSSPLSGARSVEYLHEAALEELAGVIAGLGLRRPVLIGHSDGATIALIHATRHPVRGLALIAPHVYVEPAATEGIERTDRSADMLIARLERYHDHGRELYSAWRDIWLAADFAAWNIENDIRGLRVPMLLVQGSDDEYGTLDQLDRIEAAVGVPTERVVVEGAGHSPHLSHPIETTEAVVGFVRSSLS